MIDRYILAVHSERLVRRFWRRIDSSDPQGCWPFDRPNKEGYGNLRLGTRPNDVHLLAHRVAYTLKHGPIPEDMTIDHLCRNRACCNPDHMEPVTRAENVLRGESLSAQNARKTHCKNGHEFTPENTRVTHPKGPGRVHRACRACDREKKRLDTDQEREADTQAENDPRGG